MKEYAGRINIFDDNASGVKQSYDAELDTLLPVEQLCWARLHAVSDLVSKLTVINI